MGHMEPIEKKMFQCALHVPVSVVGVSCRIVSVGQRVKALAGQVTSTMMSHTSAQLPNS